MLSASNTASIGGNATSSNSPGLHEDDKTATVKMEVLDDLFGPGSAGKRLTITLR